MNFRILPFETVSPAQAMAVDEALLRSVNERPAVRFYRWQPPGAVTIGDQQDASEIQPVVPVVRRLSPGRGLYHGPEDLTYAVAGLRSHFASLPRAALADHLKAYYAICSWITSFLRAYGAPTVYNRSASILVDGRKVSGNAQAHLPSQGAFYQHGSIFCFSDAAERADILTRLHSRPISAARTASVREFTADPPAAIESAFVSAFTNGIEELGHSWEPSALTPAEQRLAEELIETKYGTDSWNRGGTMPRGSCETTWGEHPDRPEPL